MTQNAESSPKPDANGRPGPLQDQAYETLRSQSRVVMRHNIALNLDRFKAAPEGFSPRPQREFPPLKPVRPPFFSVIVPNYNGRRFLPGLLQALEEQTFQDFEVILADDASTDDSVAFVEARYPWVRVVMNRRNQGFVATANLAADLARGRVLVLLNNDTEPEPGWLAELAQAVCTHPDAAIIASKILLFDDRQRLHTAGDALGADGIPRNRGVWEEDRGQYDQDEEVFSGCGGGMAVRREVWQALGGFDEDFWMYLDDVDLAFRARLMGWRVVFAPAARLYHHLSGSGGDTLSSYYVGRNTIWTLVKNMPGGLLARRLPWILAAQGRIAWEALTHIQGEAARARLRGQLAGIRGLPRMVRKRQIIQARRVVGEAEIERVLDPITPSGVPHASTP